MDPPVGDEFLQRKPRDLPPNRIEARHDDSIGRVVDDDIDSGGQLERANVSPFATDDASLHLIVR